MWTSLTLNIHDASALFNFTLPLPSLPSITSLSIHFADSPRRRAKEDTRGVAAIAQWIERLPLLQDFELAEHRLVGMKHTFYHSQALSVDPIFRSVRKSLQLRRVRFQRVMLSDRELTRWVEDKLTSPWHKSSHSAVRLELVLRDCRVPSAESQEVIQDSIDLIVNGKLL
jgi:hypothetical protein